MKILVSLFFLSFSAYSACHFKAGKVYSLSGSATKVMEELGIANDLKGVSVFYPKMKDFKGEIIPGGIFLSPSRLEEMNGAVVFFDRSQEMKKTLSRAKITAVEITDRGKTPSEVVSYIRDVLGPYIDGCDFSPVMEKTKKLETEITALMKEKGKVIFFLGEVGKGKLPELVIANDGFILWLKKLALIDSYPSELAYVNWSGAILESKKKDHLFLGLKEGDAPSVTGDKTRATFIYPGVLTPGLHQLEAWKWFLDSRNVKGRF